MTLVNDVTGDTYADKARSYIASNGSKGFLIVQWPVRKNNTELVPTLKQWGAWRAYFQLKKINMGWFEHRAYYTVPAEWPHLFDASATIAADVECGNDFVRAFHVKRQPSRARIEL